VPSLLVTNDFPPKLGGIQSYLYELWRRLPPDDTTVLTSPYRGAQQWDAEQSFRVERIRAPVLMPTRSLARRIDALAREVDASVTFVDPMLPLGLLARYVRAAPHVIVTHGAEITVPGRLPGSRQLARHVLRGAAGIVAAGSYPAREAVRAAGSPLPTLIVPPGVDVDRFRPAASEDERRATRERFGISPDRPLVLGLSRLVPRKGFDVLIDAIAGVDAPVQLAIAGAGRDRRRLEGRAAARGLGARVRFLGRVPDADLPSLYACADVFAMLCHDRWGGLEAEGFGIVFVEAAASGVASIAGRSGGAHEAVADGETGYVVEPRDVVAVRDALEALLRDDELRCRFGAAARARAVEQFSYEHLVARLAPLAAGDLGTLDPFTG
jgi:phosphatidyl-myo-inositol dimannoside synthase